MEVRRDCSLPEAVVGRRRLFEGGIAPVLFGIELLEVVGVFPFKYTELLVFALLSAVGGLRDTEEAASTLALLLLLLPPPEQADWCCLFEGGGGGRVVVLVVGRWCTLVPLVC